MARGNKRGSSTPRGGRRGRGRGHQRGGRFSAAPEIETYYSPTHGSFSLADEARNTSQHTHWDTNSSLRNKPVLFVSAGASEPLKQLEDDIIRTEGLVEKDDHDPSAENQSRTSDPKAGFLAATSTPEMAEDGPAVDNTTSQHREDDKGDDEKYKPPDGLFYYDVGRETFREPTEDVSPNHTYAETSSSEEDVILFTGRDSHANMSDRKKNQQKSTNLSAEVLSTSNGRQLTGGGSDRSNIKNRPKSGNRARGPKLRRKNRAEEDDLMADYISNMQENGEIEELITSDSRNIRDLGGSQDEADIPQQRDHNGVQKASVPAEIQPAQASSSQQALSNDNDTAQPQYSSASELDDELLARLIAGQDLNDIPDQPWEDDSSSSSTDTDDEVGKNGRLEIDDFDLMDWDRPSLRKRKKGKAAHSRLDINLSDDDLEQAMQVAWKNDRLKKSQRKKQREELRALGMLGKNAGKPDDLRTKYPDGMNLEQVAEETRFFLRGDNASLTFPPMDTHARKMIHELANKFNIKSKSTGKADQRRPSLYRTGRTLPFVEAVFDQAVARINRRYFPRLDVKGKRNKRPNPPRGNDAAASYRDGEVVGAAAPELGSSNRGRAMLEKMGWSTGTALGAMDNKGILQPVPQTMKKSKAGLG